MDLGASTEKLTEVMALVSAVGVHALHEGARVIAAEAEEGIRSP
jgi:hypothetical protein